MDKSPPARSRGRPRAENRLQVIVRAAPFETAVAVALAEISTIENTRAAYRRDFDAWVEFAGELGVDVAAPIDGASAAFLAWLQRRGDAPKSCARRMSSLSSIYRALRRKKIVAANPFSVDDGPKRPPAPAIEPTPMALPGIVARAIAACDESPMSRRDEAIMRVLWSTGMRRVSLLSMTHEKLARDPAGYVATVIKKGGENQRALIKGRAAAALTRWLALLKGSQITSGAIWRDLRGLSLSPAELGRMLKRRGGAAGGALSPHMFRVAFLTINPASLESKQDAAGHADPETTRGYDRASWRGRAAFEQMPEPEEVSDSGA